MYVLRDGLGNFATNGAMLFMALGFVLITVGTSVTGFLFGFMGFGLLEVEVVNALANSIGFSLLAYSIYGKHG